MFYLNYLLVPFVIFRKSLPGINYAVPYRTEPETELKSVDLHDRIKEKKKICIQVQIVNTWKLFTYYLRSARQTSMCIFKQTSQELTQRYKFFKTQTRPGHQWPGRVWVLKNL